MVELKQILLEHAKRYPRMQPTDAVKLIYQNEFGGGHLIRDEEACLRYLRQEYEQVKKRSSIPLYEEIGNGMIRVNLAAVQKGDLEQLGAIFIRSAAEHKGNLNSFLEKLDVLKASAEEGVFAFRLWELEDYLEDYAKAGYPAVSHSPEYREQYSPTYRIVCAEFYLKQRE